MQKIIKTLLLFILILSLPNIAQAKGGGGGGGGHSSSSSGSRSSGVYHSSSGGSRVTGSLSGRPRGTTGYGQIRSSNGSYRNVHTINGAPLVLRQGGKTYVNGVSWQSTPIRNVQAQTIAGRRTVYWQQPTRIVKNGTVYNLNNGPRVQQNQPTYRTQQDFARQQPYVAYSMGLYHPYYSYNPYYSYYGCYYGCYSYSYNYSYSYGMLFGYELGLNHNNNQNYQNNFNSSGINQINNDDWNINTVPNRPLPTATPEPDTTIEKNILKANIVQICSYKDTTQNPIDVPVRTRQEIGCPSSAHSPKDLIYPDKTIFCIYNEIYNGTDSVENRLTLPVASEKCPIAVAPTPTPNENIEEEPQDDDSRN